MGLDAGSLNRRITIMRRSPGEDEAGGPNGAWDITVCRPWANFRAPTGIGSIMAERVSADREVSTTTCSWRIRYRTDILATDRVEESDGTLWDIKQVLVDRENREHVDLVCLTGASDG